MCGVFELSFSYLICHFLLLNPDDDAVDEVIVCISKRGCILKWTKRHAGIQQRDWLQQWDRKLISNIEISLVHHRDCQQPIKRCHSAGLKVSLFHHMCQQRVEQLGWHTLIWHRRVWQSKWHLLFAVPLPSVSTGTAALVSALAPESGVQTHKLNLNYNSIQLYTSKNHSQYREFTR